MSPDFPATAGIFLGHKAGAKRLAGLELSPKRRSGARVTLPSARFLTAYPPYILTLSRMNS